jgi:hypothetical protein
MTPASEDRLLEALRRLPAADADPGHDARVRRRCHEAVAERRRGPSYRFTGLVRRRVEVTLVGAFGVVYLLAILYDAARILMP